MTDPKHKIDPDPAGTSPSSAGAPRADASTPSGAESASGDKEPFNPFKFQSITMPPGLRAEILEHARNRPPERVPEDTLPPNQGVSAPATAPDDASTIHIANDNEDTQRLPRVILAQARRRRQRVAVIAVALLAALALGVAVWNQQRIAPDPLAMPAAVPGSPTSNVSAAAVPAVAATTAVPAELGDSHSAAAPSAAGSIPAPPEVVPSSEPSVASATEPDQPALRPHTSRPRPERGSPPAMKSPKSRSGSASKASNAKGTDLLDFQGPAPK